jgi:hypothetical protein
MTALSRMTKQQLLEHVSDLNDMLNRAEIELASQRPVPVKERLAVIGDELVCFARDVYTVGCLCRKGFDQVVDTLRQPVLKNK